MQTGIHAHSIENPKSNEFYLFLQHRRPPAAEAAGTAAAGRRCRYV
jgi:hypothetical protein